MEIFTLYGDVDHLKHPPCAHGQPEHGSLPLERHGRRVEDVPDKPRWSVPHPQDVPGEQINIYSFKHKFAHTLCANKHKFAHILCAMCI